MASHAERPLVPQADDPIAAASAGSDRDDADADAEEFSSSAGPRGIAAAPPGSGRRRSAGAVIAGLLMLFATALVVRHHRMLRDRSEGFETELKQEAQNQCAAEFEQCGGDDGYAGPQCCQEGCTCGGSGPQQGNYKQCAPVTGYKCSHGAAGDGAKGEAEGPEEEAVAVTEAPTEPPKKKKPEGCAWNKESCVDQQCCNIPGMTCFEKGKFWGECKTTCDKGPDPNDGEAWTCKELGGYPKRKPLAPADDGDKVTGTSLYCFTVVLPMTYEVHLVFTQKEHKLGIFACDESAVFTAASVPKEGAVKKISMVTKYFAEIWDEVFFSGAFEDHDWTVKVEPDTVFIASRLRASLAKLKAPAGSSLYIKNSKNEPSSNFGAPLQIFSKKALEVYGDKKDVCVEHLEHLGESTFLLVCMEALGVHFMEDSSLLNDMYVEKQLLDRNDTSECGEEPHAAFHPYRKVDAVLKCYSEAQGEEVASEDDDDASTSKTRAPIHAA